MSERLIGLVLYPGFTALDIVGPYEVLCRLGPQDTGGDWRTIWVAETLDPVRSDRGMTVVPDTTFDACPPLEVFVVPGGPGQMAQMGNEAILGFLRDRASGARLVSSVCTGSLLLGAAGLLDGRRATAHWLWRDMLSSFGAVPVAERVVRDGNVLTAAGVSAGIDFALALVADLEGEGTAQAIQLGIEYDPQPPFDAGSPEKAPQALVEAMRARAADLLR